MQTIQYDYASLTKEKLVEHCEAYAHSIHELADEVMKLRWRIQMAEKALRMFDNLEIA